MGEASQGSATIYFGFGSNLWQEQMKLRCPTSAYLGIARLDKYRWIINERGYANVVEISASSAPSSSSQPDVAVSGKKRSYANEVWGLVYSLQPDDEDELDHQEGVPKSYTKQYLDVDFWPSKHDGKAVDPSGEAEKRTMLVYVDRKRTTADKPKKEYVYRMNKGISDALKEGVPKAYVEEVMRKFIPALEDEAVEEWARKQAVKFEDEM